MKLVITGASGYIGRLLVSDLTYSGHQLVLVGRDDKKLKVLFPDHVCFSYEKFDPIIIGGCEACLHLATRNSNQSGSMDTFLRDNVEALHEFCGRLHIAGVYRQLYVSSILACAEATSPYAVSKWHAEQKLRHMQKDYPGWHVQIFRPAFIHALPYRGKAAFLNRLPTALAQAAFLLLASFKTSVPYKDFVARIMAAIDDPSIGATEPEILTNEQNGNWVYAFMRRTIDYTITAIVLALFGWLTPIIILLIRVTSPGPAFFVQKRIGKEGVPFPCFKFRTMQIGTKQAATHEISPISVTPIGRLLRSYKIDELPQILNILRGELSFVGPRPCLPEQRELIEHRRKYRVLDHLPGITGYAQVNNIDMSNPEKLARTDASYIARRTLLLDLKIIIRTFLRHGSGDRVQTNQGR